MSLWVYKKFNNKITRSEVEIKISSKPIGDWDRDRFAAIMASQYSIVPISSSTSKFRLAGSSISVGYQSETTGYCVSSTQPSFAVDTLRDVVNSMSGRDVGAEGSFLLKIIKEPGYYFPYLYRADTTVSKGEFIEEIIAEDGAYPANGHTGGFWYVKDRLANRIVYQNQQVSIPNFKMIHKGVEYR